MELKSKKILILHTSVGLGHKMIAENIGYALRQAGFTVRLEDIGNIQKGKFSRTVKAVHLSINKRLPFVWAFLYKWGHYPILPFRVFIAGFNYRQTLDLVNEFQPDLVITVQTTASAVIAYLRKKRFYRKPWGIAFSDYHLHPYWLYPGADFYLANINEQKEEMIRRGIPADKIFVCGMTIKPKLAVNSQVVRQKLGIAGNQKVILIGAGSLGIGLDEKIIGTLRQEAKAAVVVVCGKNQELYQSLQKFCGPDFKVLGFYKPMDELYAIADVFATKPGGLTTAESLQWRLPMIVTHWLPGQEELNIFYLKQKGLIIARPENLIEAVRKELATGEFRGQLKANPNVIQIVSEGEKAVLAVKQELARHQGA